MIQKDRLIKDTKWYFKMWYFIALCLLAVNAQNSTDTSPEKQTVDGKVEPKNISALYIGDLLRTKPKDDLEAAGSVPRPNVAGQDLESAASVPYKTHGGHEYTEALYHPTYPESRATGAIKRTGAQAPSIPFNVKGHILTLKPVRLLSADHIPASRNPERNHKDAHYPGDDCSKSSDRSYSSEEKPYAPEAYRRAKQTASNPDLEYRNPPTSYYDDDKSEAYSSQSDPSSGSYRSKTYPSRTNTKSESSGSYTTSKSTSTSKTITPNKPKTARIIPTVINHKENYDKKYGTPHKDQGFIVYKVKEPSNQNPRDYPESSEREYPPSDYDSDQKPAVREPYYSQHSSGPRKSRKYSQEKPTRYTSSEPKERPQQYGSPHYEEDKGGYDHGSYKQDEDQHYRGQKMPSNNQNESKYPQQYDGREPESTPYHQSYEPPVEQPSYSNVGQNNKPYHGKKKISTQYEKPPVRGREQDGYRTQGHSNPEYGPSQSSRGKKVLPQRDYETYPAQYNNKEVPPQPQAYDRTQQSYDRPQQSYNEPQQSYDRQHESYDRQQQSYDRTQPAIRQSEKQSNQHDTTPYQTNTKQSEIQSSTKRPYRESSTRYARSPEEPSVIVEGRALLPAAGNQPVIMITRESKPYVSRSESFSESGYNTGNNENPKSSYRQQKKIQAKEGRHAMNPHYQTTYKPFNSEYPANYANDPMHHNAPMYHNTPMHHNAPRKHAPRSYERPPAQPDTYNAPVYSQAHPHSGEAPQQYQEGKQGPYQSGETYDQGYDHEDSSEQGGRPVKKSKNHHYISNIEGYKDTYAKDEPLVIDEEFFKKYGISPSAKVIVANAENPNLFVADGSGIKEGEYFANGGPKLSLGPSYESKPDSDYGSNSGPSSGPTYESNPDSGYGPSSADSEENYEPGYKSDFKEDPFSSSQEELGPPRQIPGSFDDLVDTNPKFLRHLPQLMKNEDGFFKMDSTEASFHDIEFPKVGEQRGYIVSRKPGEIVQQHGDGVSRIVFNVPKVESRAEASNGPRVQGKGEMEEQIVEAATNLIKDIIKSESKN